MRKGNVRKFLCWGCIKQAGLWPGSSRQKSKGSSPVSFCSWQWALLSLGISSLCGSWHGTSAPPKPTGLPLLQLATVRSIKLLYPPTVHYWPGMRVLKLRTTGGRRREALEVNFLSQFFLPSHLELAYHLC